MAGGGVADAGARVAVGVGSANTVGVVVGKENVGALVCVAKIGRTREVGFGAADGEQAATSNRAAPNSARLRLTRMVPLIGSLDKDV